MNSSLMKMYLIFSNKAGWILWLLSLYINVSYSFLIFSSYSRSLASSSSFFH
jgi:hypothetical protein